MTKTLDMIRQFLSQEQIALIGVSRNPKDFSRSLMRDLRAHGIHIVPVNLHADEIDGTPCARTILEIQPPVPMALIMTPKAGLKQAVLECSAAGVSTVWLFGINGVHEIPSDILELCASRHINVIPGYCPSMFLKSAGWFHRLHGSFNKTFGLYPT